MKRFLLFISIIFISCLQANAQNKNLINGSIIDSTSHQPVQYATITFSDVAEGKIINGASTDSLGFFKINNLKAGTYNILIESIGFAKKTIHNFQVKQSHIPQSIGIIKLSKTENTLKDVVVTTAPRLIDNKIDKLVFNAENDITSSGGVATDVLKKVPQISVDADGNVELAGSSDIRFLINGKPSTAFGNNIADVLQAIPASEIKSIEVVTNPGAKYDAQGLGGVINIILKKSRINGINGNLSLTAGTRLENGSFNITMKKNNFSVNAFASGMKRLTSATPTILDRTSIDTIAKQNTLLHQQSEPQTNRSGFNSGIGFDWTIDSSNSLSGNVNFNHFGNAGSGIVNQQQQIIAFNSTTPISDINSFSDFNNGFLFYSTDASINYIKKFAKEDQTLEVDVNTSFGHNNFNSNNYQTLVPQDSVFYGVNNKNFGKQNESEIQIDYTDPFTDKINFGCGADFTFDDILSNANVFALQPSDKIYTYDSSISNYLNYHQKVYAAYAELSFPIAKSLSAKVGSRYERTEINSFYSNATAQVKTPGYNTFVPSMYLLEKLTDNQSLKLSFSRRIERPDYEDLNPFINTTDPKNISAGNPYLRPETGYRIEFAYNHNYGNSGSFMITAFYRQSNNDIQPYTIFYPSFQVGDSVYTNVSVNTSENIGIEKNIGLNLFGTIKATDKFNIRTNLFFFRRHILNGIDLGRSPVSFNYRINMNASYQFTKTFVAEMFGNFNSPRNEIQGRYPSFTNYTIAARKQFWNKKGSLALTATNIVSKYLKLPTVLYGTNFTTNNYRNIPLRSIGLNFTWKFGKLDFKKNKDDNDNEKNNSMPEG